MSTVSFDEASPQTWMALKRLDRNDDRVVSLRQVSVPPAADVTAVMQILSSVFGVNPSDVVFKIRNRRGCMIPANGSVPASSKRMPHVLEVTKVFQHVCPSPRTIPTALINQTVKTRLQTIDRRIRRLEDLLPQIKLRRHEKLNQEIDCLNQKLRFLQKRMQVADSQRWKGELSRAPLW